MDNDLGTRIMRAQAARAELERLERLRAEAAQLDALLEERDRQRAAQMEAQAQTLEEIRGLLDEAARQTAEWVTQYVELCHELDAAPNPAAAEPIFGCLGEHTRRLLEIHRPVLDARRRIEKEHGARWPVVWRELGGGDPRFIIRGNLGDLAHRHKRSFDRWAAAHAIYDLSAAGPLAMVRPGGGDE